MSWGPFGVDGLAHHSRDDHGRHEEVDGVGEEDQHVWSVHIEEVQRMSSAGFIPTRIR